MAAAQAVKLTQSQRKALFAGECPRIAFPGDKPCPAKVGDVAVLSKNVRLEVTGIRRNQKGEWSLQYTLWDQRLDRTRYLAPAGFHTVPIGEDGNTAPMTPEEELGYTTNPQRALEPDAPSVSLADQNVLDMQARDRFAQHRESERAEETRRRDHRQVVEAIRRTVAMYAQSGGDTTEIFADIQRVLNGYEGKHAA